MLPDLPRDRLLDIYRRMLVIRRFEEAMICSEGEAPIEPIHLAKLEGLSFLTDGYGPSSALHQLSLAFEIPASRPEAQAEGMDAAGSALTTE